MNDEKLEFTGEVFEKFLRTLFPDIGGCFVEFRCLHQEYPPQIGFLSIDDVMKRWQGFGHSAKERNVYFGVCPRSQKDGSKASIKLVWVLWVDLDAKDFKGGKREVLDRVKSFPFPPTIVVDSGNGFHVYWRLKESMPINTNEDRIRIESVLKALARGLNGDLACAEIARILRLPGTLNRKNTPPAPVFIVELEPSRQYSLNDFECLLIKPEASVEKKVNPPGWIAEALLGLKQGNRHETFLKVTGRLNHDKWSQDDIIALLAPHAEGVHYSVEQLHKEVADICRRYPNGNSFLVATNNKGETETKSRPFEVMTVAQFLGAGSDQIDWCIEGILPSEGVGILAAPAGYGKSWMTLDLALECCLGGNWLGKFPAKKVKVLYFDEESSPPLLRKRLNKLLIGKGVTKETLDIELVVGQGLCFSDQFSVLQLRELMIKHQPGLVIVDSLIRVHKAEENSAKEMANVFGVIKSIIREFKCAFLFCDHQRKPGPFSGGMDLLLRGSTEKAAFVDTLLSLRKKEKLLVVEHSKSRFAEAVSSFLVVIEDPTETSTKVSYSGEADVQVQEERMKMVMDFLSATLKGKDWVSRAEIVAKSKDLTLSEKTVDETLKHCADRGLIQREDRKGEGRGGKKAFYKWCNVISSPSPTPEVETEIDTDSIFD